MTPAELQAARALCEVATKNASEWPAAPWTAIESEDADFLHWLCVHDSEDREVAFGNDYDFELATFIASMKAREEKFIAVVPALLAEVERLESVEHEWHGANLALHGAGIVTTDAPTLNGRVHLLTSQRDSALASVARLTAERDAAREANAPHAENAVEYMRMYDELREAVQEHLNARDIWHAGADEVRAGKVRNTESVLRDLVEKSNKEYCAQCWLNGAGRFEMQPEGECPNSECVTKREGRADP